MYADFNQFYCYNKKCVTHKSRLFSNPYLAKHTTANIDATFSNSNILNFTQNSLELAYLFIAMLCKDTNTTYCVYT